MGYRMHIRTVNRVSYSDRSFFNNHSNDVLEFFEKYIPLVYCNENGDYWEIPRRDLINLCKKLKSWSKKNPNRILFGTESDGYTNSRVYDIICDILNSTKNKKNFEDPSRVIVEWF